MFFATDPVDPVEVVLLTDGRLRVVGCLRPLRGLEVDGDEKRAFEDVRRILELFLRGTGLSLSFRDMKGEGIGGRDKDALGVVIVEVSGMDFSGDGGSSDRSMLDGGPVWRRFSSEDTDDLHDRESSR